MKSLKEQVNDIVTSKSSKQVKSASLIKLGLRKHEVLMLLGTITNVSKAKAFKVNALTFGVEIECYNVIRDALIAEVEQRNISIQSQRYNHDSAACYKIVSDCSISGVNGNEVVSPILKGKEGENSLKEVCSSLNAIDAKVNKSTGLHVHFGAENLSDAHFVNIFKNYAKLEKVIDSFMPESRKANNNRYCKSITNFSIDSIETKQGLIRATNDRYLKVNVQSYLRHRTIEFRQHSGTTDYSKIISWVNFLRKLINFSFDSEIENCATIEEVPFLTKKEKEFFISRRNQLA
ncbi:MAG: amidoligase family protein [Rikenellaceae bacterium]